MQNSYEYEEEINILDLFFYCLSHWKSILAALLIGAVLGGGFVVMQSVGSKQGQADVAVTEEAKVSDDVLKKQLTEQLYQITEQRMADLEGYLEETRLLDLNPYDLYQGAITFKITAAQSELSAVQGAVYSYVLDGQLFAEIQEQTGLYTSRDLQQLITIPEQKMGVDGAVSIENFLISGDGRDGSGTLAVTVLSGSEEEAQQLLAQIETSVSAYLKSLKGQYDVNEVAVLESVITQTQSTKLADYQDALRTRIVNEKKNLSTYLTELEGMEDISEEVQDASQTVNTGVSKKKLVIYTVLGAMVGCIGMGGLWILVYFLGGRLFAVSNLEGKFRVKTLGTIHDFQGLKALNLWIAQKRGGIYSSLPLEEQRKIALLNVKNELKKDSTIQNVFLASSLGGGLAEAATLKAGLEAEGYTVQDCANVIGRADVLEKASKCDAVVVLESTEASKTALVAEEVAVLQDYVKNVVGMVVVGNKA